MRWKGGMSDIQGMTQWYDKYGVLGLSTTAIQGMNIKGKGI